MATPKPEPDYEAVYILIGLLIFCASILFTILVVCACQPKCHDAISNRNLSAKDETCAELGEDLLCEMRPVKLNRRNPPKAKRISAEIRMSLRPNVVVLHRSFDAYV